MMTMIMTITTSIADDDNDSISNEDSADDNSKKICNGYNDNDNG